MITIGPKCRIVGVRPELAIGLMAINAVLGEIVMVLSHVTDGTHTRASIHYAGGAGDLVFKHSIPPYQKELLYKTCAAAIGPDFDLLFEDREKANEHWHLEYQPKEPY